MHLTIINVCHHFLLKLKQLFNFTKRIYLVFLQIFGSNKRILLYVIQEKILIIDDYIFSCWKNKFYTNQKYLEYFSPEFYHKPPETDLFFQNRIDGENDAYVCKIIPDDSIIEFIKYFNKTNFSLLSRIPTLPFETNAILLKNELFCLMSLEVVYYLW